MGPESHLPRVTQPVSAKSSDLAQPLLQPPQCGQGRKCGHCQRKCRLSGLCRERCLQEADGEGGGAPCHPQAGKATVSRPASAYLSACRELDCNLLPQRSLPVPTAPEAVLSAHSLEGAAVEAQGSACSTWLDSQLLHSHSRTCPGPVATVRLVAGPVGGTARLQE